jgi:hypothetical protein
MNDYKKICFFLSLPSSPDCFPRNLDFRKHRNLPKPPNMRMQGTWLHGAQNRKLALVKPERSIIFMVLDGSSRP